MDRFGQQNLCSNTEVKDEEYAKDLYWTLVAVRSYLRWKKNGFPVLDISDVVNRKEYDDISS